MIFLVFSLSGVHRDLHGRTYSFPTRRSSDLGTEGVINLGWNDFVLKKHLLPEAPGYGGWDLYGTFPEDVKKSFVARYDKEYPPETRKVTQPEDIQFAAPEGYDDRPDHFVNFF